jgi:hypothetical protein
MPLLSFLHTTSRCSAAKTSRYAFKLDQLWSAVSSINHGYDWHPHLPDAYKSLAYVSRPLFIAYIETTPSAPFFVTYALYQAHPKIQRQLLYTLIHTYPILLKYDREDQDVPPWISFPFSEFILQE